ncbi:MAG: SDR family NAD(P)-dependent oxidoreductase, partial [Candidatus Syntrophosphaera sp.]|nr:SDR family NAD(P)-dependent oxidoreductase [Candidatus Syntrophosphaera sp.]
MTIITGANGQVGSHLARHYAGSGEPLLLLYHKEVQRIAELDGLDGVLLQSCDLCSFEETRKALDSASQKLTAVPARLIHTAAVRSSDAKTLAESDPLVFNQVLGSNLVMAYNILRNCLPGMIANQFGRVVIFGSNVALTGLKNGAAYSAAKAALVNLVK